MGEAGCSLDPRSAPTTQPTSPPPPPPPPPTPPEQKTAATAPTPAHLKLFFAIFPLPSCASIPLSLRSYCGIYADDTDTTAEAEIPIADLLNDAVIGAPGLLDDDQSVTGRLMGSSQSHRTLLGVSKSKKIDTPIIKAFRAKLQEVGWGAVL